MVTTSAVVEMLGRIASTPPALRGGVITAFEVEHGVDWDCPAFDAIFSPPAPPPAAPVDAPAGDVATPPEGSGSEGSGSEGSGAEGSGSEGSGSEGSGSEGSGAAERE